MFGPFKKERPVLGVTGLGGGVGSGLVSGGDAWTPSGITATGGTKLTGVEMPDGTPYTYHSFPAGPHGPATPAPNPFNVTAIDSGAPAECEFIMVAGGGIGGGSWNPNPDHGGGGGAGAGGIITNFKSPNAQSSPTTHPFTPVAPGPAQTLTVTVQDYPFYTGKGGSDASDPGRHGGDTTAFGYTAVGGGCGANSSPTKPAEPGGSGGGGGAQDHSAGTGTANQGTAGGGGAGVLANGAGGGGGASQAGEAHDAGRGGGNGINFPLPTAGFFGVPSSFGVIEPTSPAATDRWFCGGGSGGGPHSSPGSAVEGGYGGGGNSGDPDSQGQNAPTGSGGGAGGSGGGSDNSYYGHGGGGIIIVRYID